MQYVTTRNEAKIYSPYHALNDLRAEDDGLYIPKEEPAFTAEEIGAFALKNPNQALAEILDLLFDADLNRWSVDFAVGRYPVRLRTMNRRIAVAECWHNQDWELSRVVRDLAALVRGTRAGVLPTGSWAEVAVRAGILFGLFGELTRDGIADREHPVDVAVASADLTAAAAALLAKRWGLPLGKIIICCNENNHIWHLVNYGELRTQPHLHSTTTPLCDQALPLGLEWLLYACGGREEVHSLVGSIREGKSFYADPDTVAALQKDIYVSVVGKNRVSATIAHVYKDSGYVFGPYSALTFAGIQDYRSNSGTDNQTLLLSERGALCDDGFVAGKLNMAVSQLHKIL